MFISKFKFSGITFVEYDKLVLLEMGLGTRKSDNLSFHFVNAYSLVLASKSSNFSQLLRSNIVFCDGWPIKRIAERQGIDLNQIRGIDVFRRFLYEDGIILRHFLIGSDEDTLDRIKELVENRIEKGLIVGSIAPPFMDSFESLIGEWIHEIRIAKPNLVWVGLGTPKQDFVAHTLARSLDMPVLAVGAAFEVVAKVKKEAPVIIQKIGLEWFFRLIQEPRRLWKRYIFGNLRFARLVFKHIFLEGEEEAKKRSKKF